MRPCSTCQRDDVEAIDAALHAGTSVRAAAIEFGVSRSAMNRHKVHAIADQAASSAVEMTDKHTATARALIAQAQERAGYNWSAQDAAEAEYLLSISSLVDGKPGNVTAMKELRLTIAEFRRQLEARPDELDDEALAVVESMRIPDYPHPDRKYQPR